MRKPQITNPIKCQQHQSGFTLIMVLAIMLVVAIMVIASAQNTSVESRLSANDADRKATLALAELALSAGENQIILIKNKSESEGGVKIPEKAGNIVFFPQSAQVETGGSILDNFGQKNENKEDKAQKVNGLVLYPNQNTPEYIIEFLSEKHARVTARAWGRNNNTFVTLQSYVEF